QKTFSRFFSVGKRRLARLAGCFLIDYEQTRQTSLVRRDFYQGPAVRGPLLPDQFSCSETVGSESRPVLDQLLGRTGRPCHGRRRMAGAPNVQSSTRRPARRQPRPERIRKIAAARTRTPS